MKNRRIFGMLLSVIAVAAICLTGCASKHTITFNTNGGTAIEAITLEEGAAITVPTTTLEDMTFGGWCSDVDLTTDYTFPETMPNEDITVYAKWVVTLSFDSRGGSAVSSVVAGAKKTFTFPADPVREGFTFVGWYTTAEYTTKQTFIMPEKNSTCYAKWQVLDETTRLDITDMNANEEAAYTVTTTGGKKTFTATAEKGSYSYVKTFINVNAKEFTTVVMDIIGTKDIDILLKLEQGGVAAVEKAFTMTGESQRITWTVTEDNLTETGGEMFLFFLNPGVAGANETTPEYVTVNGVYLYHTVDEADAGKQVAMHFNTNGGSMIPSIYSTKDSAVAAPTAPTRSGYEFAGWYSDRTLETPYTFTTMPEAAITLYAAWTKLNVELEDLDLIDDTWSMLDADAYEINVVEGALVIKQIVAKDYSFIRHPMTGLEVGGYNILKAEVQGTAGEKITFKINDQLEQTVVCDGTKQYVEFEFDFDLNPEKALLIFVQGGLVETSNEFTITKLAYSNVSEISENEVSFLDAEWVENDADSYEITKEAGKLLVKRTANSGWAFAYTSLAEIDPTLYTKLVVTIKGTAGTRVLVKPYDAKDLWVDCTGEEVTAEVDITSIDFANLTDAKQRLLVFANGSVDGPSDVYEITQISFK